MCVRCDSLPFWIYEYFGALLKMTLRTKKKCKENRGKKFDCAQGKREKRFMASISCLTNACSLSIFSLVMCCYTFNSIETIYQPHKCASTDWHPPAKKMKRVIILSNNFYCLKCSLFPGNKNHRVTYSSLYWYCIYALYPHFSFRFQNFPHMRITVLNGLLKNICQSVLFLCRQIVVDDIDGKLKFGTGTNKKKMRAYQLTLIRFHRSKVDKSQIKTCFQFLEWCNDSNYLTFGCKS